LSRTAFWLGLVSCLVAILGFVDLGEDWSEPRWQQLDRNLTELVQQWRSPALTRFMLGITTLGNSVLLWTLVALCLVGGRPATNARGRGVLVGLMLTASMLNSLLKAWYSRPRPGIEFQPLVHESMPSFPSGHALMSFCIYGFLAHLLARQQPGQGRRWALVAGGLVLLIGLSRIYLGAHYPGDVLGGLVVGWPCLFAAVALHVGVDRTPP
jgi:undecaprenyl-diphosphatase